LTPEARAAIDATPGSSRLEAFINLTAIRDPAAVATAHVVDSLTALASCASAPSTVHRSRVRRGYPGLPLARPLPRPGPPGRADRQEAGS